MPTAAGDLGRCSGSIASAMLATIAAYARRESPTSLQRVRIVTYEYNSPPQLAHFRKALQKIFDEATSRLLPFDWLANADFCL